MTQETSSPKPTNEAQDPVDALDENEAELRGALNEIGSYQELVGYLAGQNMRISGYSPGELFGRVTAAAKGSEIKAFTRKAGLRDKVIELAQESRQQPGEFVASQAIPERTDDGFFDFSNMDQIKGYLKAHKNEGRDVMSTNSEFSVSEILDGIQSINFALRKGAEINHATKLVAMPTYLKRSLIQIVNKEGYTEIPTIVLDDVEGDTISADQLEMGGVLGKIIDQEKE